MDGHLPVLRDEVIELLQPAGRAILLDCTLGLGGHSKALLELAPEAQLIGMDADEQNVVLAKQNLACFEGRVRFFHANFAHLLDVLQAVGVEKVDLVLADLGFCSNQMDNPERGFSFINDGPLDMRLNCELRQTAADLVNQLPEKPLADLIFQYGEERLSRRIARAIVAARSEKRIERTAQLAEIVENAYPAAVRRKSRMHPATKTFQALRIAVNDELGVLDRLLTMIGDILNPGGRAGVISFHSLEDRRVKRAFNHLAEIGQADIITKRPVVASEAEIAANPRSRSAKLRVIEKR